MRSKTLLVSLLVLSTTSYTYASVLPSHKYQFKPPISQEELQKSSSPLLMETRTLPSIEDYINYTLNKGTIPKIGYKAPEITTTPNEFKEFSQTPPNSQLKSTGINYNSDYSTNDLVYTGYTFNSGLIFPIDLREDRNAGIPINKTKSKSTNHKGLKITSTIGYRKLQGSSFEWHTGLDISGGVGENGGTSTHNIYAPIDSKIIAIRRNTKPLRGYGNSVVLEFSIGNKTYRSHFAHLSKINSNLEEGQQVKQGQYLGRIGNTGKSKGNHLHWNMSVADRYTSVLGFPQPQKSHWGEYGENFAIFDPTYIYGNTGTGKSYEEFFTKIGILNFTGTSSGINTESSYYQAPFSYSKRNAITVELPYNEKGIYIP